MLKVESRVMKFLSALNIVAGKLSEVKPKGNVKEESSTKEDGTALTLWGRRKGEKREDEKLLYMGTELTNLERLNRIKMLAKKDGYTTFRVQRIDPNDKDVFPDFKRIRQKARKRRTEKVMSDSSHTNYPALRAVLDKFISDESMPKNERDAATILIDCID